jgi:UDP-2-acetamido-2,6-beta-L-arabino-hexul-4-ose reductase
VKIVLTGAEGFLGWHTRCRLEAVGGHEVVPVGRKNFGDLAALADGADAIIHTAGINRAPDAELHDGNIALAEAVAGTVLSSARPPRFVYANSVQASDDSPYGSGKRDAAECLGQAAKAGGVEFVDVWLPNLFGEHGRPGYNSFIATFASALVDGADLAIQDREITLLHAQDAAAVLIDGLAGPSRVVEPEGECHTVAEVADLLTEYRDVYRSGAIPALGDDFHLNLFNTFRAAGFPSYGVRPLVKHTDPRGSLVETMQSHNQGGQVFFSTTAPGVRRGEHFHLHKIERFVVVSGRARIAVRRLFTDTLLTFDVSGDEPTAIDMPTMWAHNITNTGSTELLTLFWTDEIFDPDNTDTIPHPVGDIEVEAER